MSHVGLRGGFSHLRRHFVDVDSQPVAGQRPEAVGSLLP